MSGQHRVGRAGSRRGRGAPLVLAPICAVAALVTAATVSGSSEFRATAPPPPTVETPAPAAVAPAPPPVAPEPTAPTARRTDGYGQQVVDLTNAERARRGCRPLQTDAALAAAARIQAEHMARRGIVDHTGPDGDNPADRVDATGYPWVAVAENIAAGPQSPEDVVDGWMRRSGHRENILDCGFRETGVAYATGTGSPVGRYWVQVFATPAP